MRIKITGIPNMKMGGILNDYPYAGSTESINPFGNVISDTNSDEFNINASAKPVEWEDANMEAEKGELLLKNDLSGLFKIQGKRHYEGGTPLKADPGDFIFSRDKDLAITKQEKENFNFKEGGKYTKGGNTPAKVIAREVNPKHYNQLLAILNDPNADYIAKKTAEIMLGKYVDKLGQVAFLQEGKKGFPTGMPAFAMGTAPAESQEIEEAESLGQQYARYGGDSLPKYLPGGERKRRGDVLPPSFQPPYVQSFKPEPGLLAGWGNRLRQFGYTGNVNDVNAIQSWINKNAPAAAPYMYRQGYLGLNNKNYDPKRTDYSDAYLRGQFNDKKFAEDVINFQYQTFNTPAEYDEFMAINKPVGQLNGQDYYDMRTTGIGGKPVFSIPMQPLQAKGYTTPPLQIPEPQKLELARQNTPAMVPSVPVETRKTVVDEGMPWNAQEKLTTALPFLQAFMRKSQYPMLTQIHTPDIRLDRMSNEQELSDIRQQSALAQAGAFSNMSGKNAYINSGALRAETLGNIAKSNAQMNQVNTQIGNQEDMTNYQTMINDRNFNVQNVQDTYDKNNLVLARRQKELSDAFGQSINTGVAIQDKLDTLKQAMTQINMKTLDANGQPRYLLDGKTRTPILNPMWRGDIMNNPFIGSSEQKTKYQEMMKKALEELLASGDPKAKSLALSVAARLFKSDSKGNNPYSELYGENNFND